MQFHSRLLEQLAALPGVESAGGVSRFPLGTGYANGTYLKAVGDEKVEDMTRLSALFRDRSRTGRRNSGSPAAATSAPWAFRSSAAASSTA